MSGRFERTPKLVRPRVKICCIASVEEARLAVECGASAVGLVSEMPSGPGVIDEELIAEVAARVPPGVATFLLTCRQDAASIIEQQRRCRVNTIQLCDRVPREAYGELRAGLPGVSLVQVVHVGGEESLDEALSVAPYVDRCCSTPATRRSPSKNSAAPGARTTGA